MIPGFEQALVVMKLTQNDETLVLSPDIISPDWYL